MKILILGIDGYIGWPLALHLERCGHEVAGLDNFQRRNKVKSLTLLANTARHARFQFFKYCDLCNEFPRWLFENWKPDAVVHLAEMPSAPFSMRSEKDAIETHYNNVIGTLRLLWALREYSHIHLVKLGTMGEYGTPNFPIEEGFLKLQWEKNGIKQEETFLFPKRPGSFYHLTKVHDTHNIEFACRTWGLRSTDIMQGIVYGLADSELELLTRFDYDQYFGTALNRFMVQALAGLPITPYGSGTQIRSFLTLQDSIRCLQLVIENPPAAGEYRVFNQFANTYSINELAYIVASCANNLGLASTIEHLPNPRVETENHFYEPVRNGLLEFGYKPDLDIESTVLRTMKLLQPFVPRINKSIITPTTQWR